jgi:hypothetical protein
MALKYVPIVPVLAKSVPGCAEVDIQQLIADDPSILGLGPLVLRAKERVQPSGGRLDILLRNEDGSSWYEVEIQLGKTDESHIIRTIEYWDRERRSYPEISHTAVIVAEEITGRFFNVISLLQSVPIIALKLTVLKLGEGFGVTFTKVLEYVPKGLEIEDDNQTTTRVDWEKWAAPTTMAIADQILAIAKELNPGFEFNFKKNYIAARLEGTGRVFIYLLPQKKQLKLWVTLKSEPEIDKRCQDAGFDANFKPYWGGYQFELPPGDIDKHRDFFKDLVRSLLTAGEN